jgi:NADH-quinone oxidoreductase subunit J
MQIAFAILAAFTVVSAVAAMSLRNLVHCALCLALTFAGLAAIYLQLGAAFVGWAQVLVYVGAVAILIVFAILLTRSSDGVPQPILSRSWTVGIAVAALVFGVLARAILTSSLTDNLPPPKPEPTVREIGNQLMTRYILPLEVIGLLLTAAAIGAVIIAMKDSGKGQLDGPRIKVKQTGPPPQTNPELHHGPASEEVHS